MNCKKVLMGFAALLVFFYHFYIPFGREGNIFAAAYFGVDLFFFVSAYSLGKREEIKFFSFLGNRLINIYIPFVIFALITFFFGKSIIYKNWDLIRLLKVLAGIDLTENSGGAFLWYLIAIMFIYLLVPFFSRLKSELKLTSFFMLLASWFSLVFILEYVFGYTKLFILLNRLPIFFIGFYYDDFKSLFKIKSINDQKTLEKIISLLSSLIFIFIGITLTQTYGTKIRLNLPVSEFYYVLAIPAVIGFTEFFNVICSFYKPVFLNFLGSITLEIYGFQMIFGYNIENWLLKLLRRYIQIKSLNNIISFLTTLLFIISIAFLFHFVYNFIKNKCTIHQRGSK